MCLRFKPRKRAFALKSLYIVRNFEKIFFDLLETKLFYTKTFARLLIKLLLNNLAKYISFINNIIFFAAKASGN